MQSIESVLVKLRTLEKIVKRRERGVRTQENNSGHFRGVACFCSGPKVAGYLCGKFGKSTFDCSEGR